MDASICAAESRAMTAAGVDARALLGAQVSILRRERRYFSLMASSYEHEAVIALHAWSHSKSGDGSGKGGEEIWGSGDDREVSGDGGRVVRYAGGGVGVAVDSSVSNSSVSGEHHEKSEVRKIGYSRLASTVPSRMASPRVVGVVGALGSTLPVMVIVSIRA
nr:hypothetical protein [Tanacetum cinerariifolium]